MKNIGSIILNFISLLIAITGGLMSIDATIHTLGMFSPAVALWWPCVLALSTCVNRIAILVKNIYGDWIDDGVINNSYPKSTPVIAGACCLLMLCGCSTTTPDPIKNARNAGINAAGSQALVEARKVLGGFATQMLLSAAQSQLTGSKIDYMQAGTQALWTQVDANTTSEVIGDLFSAYSAGKSKQTALAAAKAAAPALEAGKDPVKVAAAVATVISTATGAPPQS